MGKVGRPKIEIDERQFEELCALQCTKEEISAVLGASEDTVERWCKRTYGDNFAVVFGQKRQRGRVSLRRNQWKLAENNATMAIWLGKQHLGQKDEQTQTSGGLIDSILKAAEIAQVNKQNEQKTCTDDATHHD